MKSIAPFFLISLIAGLMIILCSCEEQPQITRTLLELSGPVKTATLTVTGITCRYCTQKIRAALLNVPAIKTAEAYFKDQDNVVVSFYSDHLNIETIKITIEDLGHNIGQVRVE